MKSILFLCTGNSCRSQMAEGWARTMTNFDRVASAGIEAHGLNPRAVAVMSEVGVDISVQQSNSVDEFQLDDFDLVVTVCGHADEHCPAVRTARKLHWPLSDPAKLTGSDEEIMSGFRASRDEIKALVAALAPEK